MEDYTNLTRAVVPSSWKKIIKLEQREVKFKDFMREWRILIELFNLYLAQRRKLSKPSCGSEDIDKVTIMLMSFLLVMVLVMSSRLLDEEASVL